MSGGVKAALDAAMDGQADMADVIQAGLFDDLDERETGALDAPSPLARALSPRKRGRGRPPGSKNRRTEAVTAWLLQQGRHPVQVMMEAYGLSPVEFAERLGFQRALVVEKTTTTRKEGDKVITVEVEVERESDRFDNDLLLDLVKLQYRMAEASAPYVAQKLPQAVQIDAKAGVSISFEGVSLPARGAAAGNSGDVIEGQLAVRLPEVGHEKSDDDATP